MKDLDEFLGVLQCPVTGEPLERVGDDLLGRLNEAIDDGGVRTVEGEPVSGPLDAALRPAGAGFVYPVRDSIPDFVVEDRVALPPDLE